MKMTTTYAIVVIAMSCAIATACFITVSGWPLLGYVFLPSMREKDTDEGEQR